MNSTNSMKILALKKDEDRRIRAGHLWVFSNEVDIAKTALKYFSPGEFANLQNSRGQSLGTVYVNPSSLIAARLVSHRPNTPLSAPLLRARLEQALALRETLFDRPYYRLVHAEGDLLPGLVIDRYDSTFVAQITTAGMQGVKQILAEVMAELFPSLNLVFRNDTQSRALENLSLEADEFSAERTPGAELASTPAATPSSMTVEENGLFYTVPSQTGQKTGWFYDQRDNRKLTMSIAAGLAQNNKNLKVLDAFCYAGGFGAAAAAAGAKEITFLDSSESALEFAARNLEQNKFAHNPSFTGIQNDALNALEALREAGNKFNIVCLDPPAFIKRKKDEEAGLAAYYRANELGLSLVEEGGYFITSSCSQHLERESLRRILVKIAARRKLNIQIIGQGRQGADHPVHPAMPETEYLKSFFVRLI